MWADGELRGCIDDLMQFAPKDQKLRFDFDRDNGFGDGIEAYRLFANEQNDGPLTKQLVGLFLRQLQKKIWPDKHPNGEPFSPHDLRRLQANFLLMLGWTIPQIQARLDHRKLDTTLTYLSDKPQTRRDFAMIYKEGVYRNVSADPGETGLAVDTVASQLHALTPVKQTEEYVIELIDRVFKETKDAIITTAERHEFSPITPVATGNPLLTHNCQAPARYHCGATVNHCLGCKHYKPDFERLDDHKALVLRAMVTVLHNEALAQHHKLTGHRLSIYKRVETEKRLIDGDKHEPGQEGLFFHTFGRGFGMSEKEYEQLRKRMWALATKWYKKNGKLTEQPTLSHMEALLLVATDL